MPSPIIAVSAFFACLLVVLTVSIYLRNREVPEEPVSRAAKPLKPAPYDVGAFALEVRQSLSERCRRQGDLSMQDGKVQLPSIPELDIEKLSREAHQRRGYSAAFLDGSLLYGGSIVHKHMAVDENIYEGIGKMAGEKFGSFADLSSKVETYEHSLWTGLSDGTLSKVGGHVGESAVADHFNRAGIDVQWPDTSNQEGWDLLLNGHEVNPKTIKNVNQLSDHFDKYPDIPAVVPGDAENIPDDAVEFDPSEGTDEMMEAIASGQEELVIVDTELSHEEVMEQTADATDALLGDALGDSLTGGVPLVTLAISGWREAKLQSGDKTDLKSSAKNLLLDAGGTGGGAAAGAKGGAALGAAGGPLGAAAGALLGAIGGGIAGRMASNHVKKKPLRDAVEDLEESQEQLRKTAQREERRCESEFEEARGRKEKRLERKARQYSSEVRESVSQLSEWRVETAQMNVDAARKRLEEAIQEVRALQKQLKREYSGPWFRFRRRFFPTAKVLAVQRAISWAQETEQTLQKKSEEFRRANAVDRASLNELLGRQGLCRNQVLEGISRIERERLKKETELFRQIKKLQEKMGEKRAEAMESLGDFLIELRDQMRKKLKPKMDKVRDRRSKALEEADKLGVDL